jgi:hypothetical protein
MTAAWNAPTSPTEVCRRAAGRRRYNAARKRAKQDRRMDIIIRRSNLPWPPPWGIQKALAQVLGVSEAPISRDFEAIRNADKGALFT